MDEPKCHICKDTGWIGYEKPMSGIDGSIHMVFLPNHCSCEAGQREFDKREQFVRDH